MTDTVKRIGLVAVAIAVIVVGTVVAMGRAEATTAASTTWPNHTIQLPRPVSTGKGVPQKVVCTKPNGKPIPNANYKGPKVCKRYWYIFGQWRQLPTSFHFGA